MDGPLHIMAGREPDLVTPEERERFYQEVCIPCVPFLKIDYSPFHKLVKARAVERKRAIAEGKMDDPLVPKRLEDAITIVGTCMDMCPRFERYRRERENNLFEWESVCNLSFSLSSRNHLDIFQDSWNQTSRSQSRRKNV
jgi:hypothetical protein